MFAAVTLLALNTFDRDPLAGRLLRADRQVTRSERQLRDAARISGPKTRAYAKADERLDAARHELVSAVAAYEANGHRLARTGPYAPAGPHPKTFRSGWASGEVSPFLDDCGIVQVVDGRNVIVRSVELYWVECDTAGLADDTGHVFSGRMRYDGTRQYVTALGGSKTVHKFTLLN